jgi:hypothetical protein
MSESIIKIPLKKTHQKSIFLLLELTCEVEKEIFNTFDPKFKGESIVVLQIMEFFRTKYMVEIIKKSDYAI